MAALSLIVLVPMLGLAIDGANAYLARNQMNVAMDAAVLAAARSLNVGLSLDQQAAAAVAIANSVFRADSGVIRGMTLDTVGSATTAGPQFTVAQNDASHYRTVTGVLSADIPLIFMGMIHINTAHINLATAATRRDVNIVLVLDNGYPMTNVGGGAGITPLTALHTDAAAFVNLFANGRDNVGLVTFTSAPVVAEQLPNQNFLSSNILNDISSLTGTGQGGPNTSAGLEAAYQQLQTLNHQGALNVIVLFTDGAPTGFSGDFVSPTNLLTSSQTQCVANAGHLKGALWNLPDGSGNPQGLSDATIQTANATINANYDSSHIPAAGCISVPTSSTTTGMLTGIPAVDLFGNATNGSYKPVTLASIARQNVINASEDALDAAANTIRSDTTLQPVIFVIGLDGNPCLPPDPTLMARVANDPGSSSYNSSQPTGQSIIAPSADSLASAFSSIASQVLRLAAAH